MTFYELYQYYKNKNNSAAEDTSTGIETVKPITPIISQGGGGGGDGPNAPPGPGLGYDSSFASTNTTPQENQSFLDDIGEGTIDQDDLDNNRGKVGDFFSGIGDAVGGYISSGGLIGLGIRGIGGVFDSIFGPKNNYDTSQATQDAIAKDNFNEAMASGQGFYDSLNDGRGASSTSAGRDNAGGGKAANAGAAGSGWDSSPFADGGRVNFELGGDTNYRAMVTRMFIESGAEDGTGMGIEEFANTYFPLPQMASGGIINSYGY